MSDQREPPDIAALLQILQRHRVAFVLAGSVAVQAWGVDIGTPGNLDIVPDHSRDNLQLLSGALRTIDARSWPVTGRWREMGEETSSWEEFTEDHPLYGTRLPDPNPEDIRTFDSLFSTKYGELDVVPAIAGTYAEMSTRAVTMTVHGVPDVSVASVTDLLVRLTVPGRAKDAGRVQALREVLDQQGSPGVSKD